MYLKLFLVALVSFAIPSCTEDYSQYEKEFEMAFRVHNYQNRELMNYLKVKVDRGGNIKECGEVLEKARNASEYSGKICEELEKDKLDNTDYTIIKKNDTLFKKMINELKNHESVLEEEQIQIEKLVKRLEFYKDKDDRIYRLLVMGTYLQLEAQCLKIYTNQVIALNSLKHRNKSSVKVNQEYKMVLKSTLFDPSQEHLEYDSVKFSIDGIESQIAYSLRTIGGIGILKFTPNQVGIYTIKGRRYLVSNTNPDKKKLHSYFYKKNVQN